MTPQAKNTSSPPTPDFSRVVAEVLGDLAFMIADDPRPDVAPGTPWLQGEIRYQGTTHGTVRVWCTRVFATHLAANLLGLDAADGSVQVGAEDALREFLNVLCGQLVTTWYGTQDVFNLTIPTVSEALDPADALQQRATACCRFSVDGEPLICTLAKGV